MLFKRLCPVMMLALFDLSCLFTDFDEFPQSFAVCPSVSYPYRPVEWRRDTPTPVFLRLGHFIL